MYKCIWRFIGFAELQRILIANLITCAYHVVIITAIFHKMPASYYVGGILIQFILTTAIRYSFRFYMVIRNHKISDVKARVMIVGAGTSGLQIIRETRRTADMKEKIVCAIDDNRDKWNREIDDVPVVGGREKIVEAAKQYNIDKIYVTIPSISNAERKKILQICQQTDCELMALPGMYQLAKGEVSVDALKKVSIEDLLGREPVKLNPEPVLKFLEGKTVLVTGGGGSIGSEICRQVAAVPNLKQLIIFDIYENNAHAIKLELMDKYPYLNLVVLIGSVRNSRRIKQVMYDYRPNVVFHAAAHKHVPLMEDSPCEAIKNNAIGTYYTAYAAMAYGVEHFILISTDKAVNPVNIMGASKRLCEMIVQTFAKKIGSGRAKELLDLNAHTGTARDIPGSPEIPDRPVTQFAAVRFGNVLGSNGSVIPRFQEQIEKGGPVTVTHPDIIRYFMTIPEAAALVLQAASFGDGGKIYVLDMGTPVKIDSLARNMIKLSGLKPDEDIKIIYTGLRPGEKLYEERLMDEEGLQTTSNEKISVGRPLEFNEDIFVDQLKGLMEAAYEDREDIRDLVAKVVKTYHPAGEHGTEYKGEAYRKQMEEMKAGKAEA
ncbi:MAG: polysaccharide biosynthesis protein [Lachnospiraceae bacterium]|nr:polysaccharide biosynthesis protein [Lachnospiraceae bacterium]